MSRFWSIPPRGASVLMAMAVLVFTVACPAPQTTSADLTVEQIVTRHIEARGGLENIRSIKSLKETGQITAGDHRHALVTRERKRPGRMRIEFTLQGVTSVQVFDGEHGWRMSPFEGHLVPQPLPAEVEEEAAAEADIDGPLIDWKAKGHKVELEGRETIDGSEAYVLKITLKNGSVLRDYLDAESFRRKRAVSNRQARGRTVQVTATFGDYRKADGVLFPHLIEVEAAGRPQKLRVVVNTIEINPPLSDDLFEMWEPDE